MEVPARGPRRAMAQNKPAVLQSVIPNMDFGVEVILDDFWRCSGGLLMGGISDHANYPEMVQEDPKMLPDLCGLDQLLPNT